MSVEVSVPPELQSLVTALGLVDADGRVNGRWFEHPFDYLSTILSDSHQRAALLALIETVLPPADQAPATGASWHPLLDPTNLGNIYLTVEGDVIGIAAAIDTPDGITPRARASLRMALVDVSTGTVEAIAASPSGPIQLVLEAQFDEASHPSAVAVAASIDTTGNGSLRVVLDNVDPDAPAGTRTELDPTHLDAEAVRVLAHLVAQGVTEVSGGDPMVARVARNLPGVFGLDAQLPPLPIHDLVSDPLAMRAWLAAIVSDQNALRAWFTRLVGLLGSGLPAAAPTVTGTGAADVPLRAALVEFGGGSALSLTMAADTPDSGVPRLRLGVALTVEAPAARVDADVTLVALPLGGSDPAAVVPAAHILLVTPTTGALIDQPPRLKLGSVAAGLSWDGVRVTPRLDLRNVALNGPEIAVVDLTNANSVVAAGAATVQAAIEAAIGPSRVAGATLALLGLKAPESDATWPHFLNLSTFAANPTSAIAEVHRAAAAGGVHGWQHLFAELAAIFGITTPVAGNGAPDNPWRVPLASAAPVTLEVIAWNARDATTAAGTELLRFGLRLVVAQAPWQGLWRTELLAFDLPQSGSAAVRFLGGQHLSASIATATSPVTGAGLSISSGAIAARLDWTPGLDPTWRIGIENLVVKGSGETVGPLALGVPFAGFDQNAPDLGLGIGADSAVALFRLLLTEALYSWTGPAGVTIGALLGLHRGLRGLPADWPVLQAPAGGLPAIVRDPLSMLSDHRDRLLSDVSADGTPFVLLALPWAQALLTGDLPTQPATMNPPGIPLRGSGTYERPWTVPLADERLELIFWLDPDGPPRAWWLAAADRLRAARDGTALVAFAADVAGLLPDVAGALDGRAVDESGLALERLSRWLETSDGVVPTTAQAPATAAWTTGPPVMAAHEALPSAAEAIAQIRDAIDTWAGGAVANAPRAVVLFAPPFAADDTWRAYLQATEPARPEDAHFDLRGEGPDAIANAIAGVTAVATHYTAALAGDSIAEQAAQVSRIIARVKTLTGRATVYLVGHSTAGLAAAVFAVAEPASVAGVVTVGTPHGGSPLAPLADPELAGAVRLANAFYPATGRTMTGRAIADLSSAIDRVRTYPGTAFDGIEGSLGQRPGLAIPGQLADELVENLATALADRAATAAATRAAPAHVGFGVRARVDVSGASPGDVQLGVAVRVDARTIALGGAAPSTRDTPAVHVDVEIGRTAGQWLIGSADAEPGRRLRRLELGLSMDADAAGNIAAVPRLRLHNAGIDSERAWIDLPDVVARLDALPPTLRLTGSEPAAGTPDAVVADLLRALGFLVSDGSGGAVLALDAVAAAAAQPVDRLGPRVPAVLDVVAAAAGLTRAAGPTWSLQLAGTPLALTLQANPWRIGVRTFDPVTTADTMTLAPELTLGVDAELALPAFTGAARIDLALADARLRWRSDGTLTFDASPWLQPLSLVPPPPDGVLLDTLAPQLPRIAASAVISGVLSGLAGGSVRVRGIDRLLTDPAGWLTSPDGLGAANGGLDLVKVRRLFDALAGAIGAQNTNGIQLPGGIVLAANGSDPLTVSLAGTIPLPTASDEIDLEIGLAIDRRFAVAPTGRIIVRFALPGSQWSGIEIEAGADATGVALSVKPTTAPRIELLPHFSGFGALAAGAVSLLPALLQAVVEELEPQPQNATGLLRASLNVARAFGIYDFDAAGFEDPARATELARILEPGWLESKATSGTVVAQSIGAIFQDPNPLIDLPGQVNVTGAVVQWTYSLGTAGTLAASIGWTAAVTSAPMLTIGLLDTELGPVVFDDLQLGYSDGLICTVALHLDPGGELSFLAPALDFDFVNDRVEFELYPLGPGTEADLLVRFLPDPAVEMSAGGPVAILEKWALPLAARLLLREFEAELDTAIWDNGPTVRDIVEQSGLVETGSSPAALAAPLPPLPQLALGALAALADNVTLFKNNTLELLLREDQGRHGIQLKGHQDLDLGSLVLSLRFGDADWITDANRGVTFWIIEDTTDPIPVRLAPSLSLTGLGAILGRPDPDPLLEGAFEIGRVGAFMFLDANFLDAQGNVTLEVNFTGAGGELQQARINVSSDDGDSLLKKILPKELRAPFDLAVAYREGTGLTIYGGGPGGALELTFPLNIDLTLIKIAELYLALRAQGGPASLEAALTGSADIGPIHGVVQRVGLRATFSSAGTVLGFRFPDGLGLSIDAGPVSGGGFLFIDEPKGQYAGGLQLKLQTISITAIGLLNTKMPDGSPIPGPGGFSLLIIIAVEFPPIQLGFGITLNGIGGILGLNRSIDVEALRAGVRTRAIDAMLFPPDPIANAPAVIRSLTSVFPIAPNRFVVGPMVRLGWGSPPILTLDIAILLDLFMPIKIVILGRIKLALPEDGDLAVVVIKLDVVGIIDFERGEISIDAVIYDSMIAAFTITGEMALRVKWKDKPAFALSVGGFHPAFDPPNDFPSLARLAISLATGDNPRLRLEAYLAVTSNTVQFGARIELYFEAGGFEVQGELTFDALIQFSPFGMQIETSASVSIRNGGKTICSVRVSLHLTGPTPWHVWGSARVELLGIAVTVRFDEKFGPDALPPPPPAVDVAALLAAALNDGANWTAQPPAGEAVVSLRSRQDRLLAHPLGGLTFRQRVVPLALTIEVYGAAPVEGADRFEITDVSVGNRAVAAGDRDELRDDFAAAQFLELTDSEKLSRPSFERFISGVTVRFETYDIDELGADEAAIFDYDFIVVDAQEDDSAPATVLLAESVAAALATSSPAASASQLRVGARRFAAPAARVGVVEPRFAAVSILDATVGAVPTAKSFGEAVDRAVEQGAPRRVPIVRVREEV